MTPILPGSKFTEKELERARRIAIKDDWDEDDSADASSLLLGMYDEINRLKAIVNKSEITLREDNEVIGKGVFCHVERMTDKAVWAAIHHDFAGTLGKGRLVLWFKSSEPIEIIAEWDDA